MADTAFRLPPMVRAAIATHAREGGDLEVCGVLLGPHAGEGSLAVRCRNVDPEPRTRYTIDPQDLVAAVRLGEDRGLEVVGFYHSHPRGPVHPSKTDEARATWVGAAYVIRSVVPESLGAWRWTGRGFEPLTLTP